MSFRLIDVIQQCNRIFGGKATLSAVALDGNDDVFKMEMAISDAVVQLGERALQIWEQTRNHEYQLNIEVWELLLQEDEIVYIDSERAQRLGRERGELSGDLLSRFRNQVVQNLTCLLDIGVADPVGLLRLEAVYLVVVILFRLSLLDLLAEAFLNVTPRAAQSRLLIA